MKDMPEKQEEEVEIIPVTPLRKLEKRMEELESSTKFTSKEFYRELVAIIRMNQQLVNEIAVANDALRIELSKLPSKLEDMISRLDELISFIKATAEEGTPTPAKEHVELTDKFNQLVETNKKIIENNEAILSVLENIEKKFKTSYPPIPRKPPLPPVRKPIIPRKP